MILTIRSCCTATVCKPSHPLHVRAAIMFFGRMGMLAFLFGVMGGSVGVIACFIFTRIIYGWIPVE